MMIAFALAVGLVFATFIFHLWTLRWLSIHIASRKMEGGHQMLAVASALLVAHLVEVCAYAAAFAFGEHALGLGDFGGHPVSEPLDYLYFSIVSYTSLGLGDVFPKSHLRFLTGVEALNGLLLIAWSGSFIYIVMQRSWPWLHKNFEFNDERGRSAYDKDRQR